MAAPEFLDIDPRALHLPSSRLSSADPIKLHDQILRFGSSIAGMPPVLAYRGSDGAIMIYDGVTRATRVARLLPGRLIRVEVMRSIAKPFGQLTRLGDTIP
jgi:hypothetical protein